MIGLKLHTALRKNIHLYTKNEFYVEDMGIFSYCEYMLMFLTLYPHILC